MNYRIFPLGDNSLTIEFGSEISVELNNLVLKLSDFLENNLFDGFLETVPAYSSLTVFYDLTGVRQNFPQFATAYEAVKNFVVNAVVNLNESIETNSRNIEIPVCFDAEFAPDLEFVGVENNLAPKKVIEIFLGKTYRVFMLGFLPGFAYMGEIDGRIAAARKPTPRLRVPSGSVGIAGRQTGIYPLESPGGWQIIGRTPLEIFDPDSTVPAVLRVGDAVRFYEVKKSDFDNRK